MANFKTFSSPQKETPTLSSHYYDSFCLCGFIYSGCFIQMESYMWPFESGFSHSVWCFQGSSTWHVSILHSFYCHLDSGNKEPQGRQNVVQSPAQGRSRCHTRAACYRESPWENSRAAADCQGVGNVGEYKILGTLTCSPPTVGPMALVLSLGRFLT